MTDEEMIKVMEVCKDKNIPCEDCPLYYYSDCEEISRQYFYKRFIELKAANDELTKKAQQLTDENAALRERLEKAVELPFIPNDYHVEVWLAEKKQSVMDESVNIVIPVYVYVKCENNEAAEARLAELNGGNNDN